MTPIEIQREAVELLDRLSREAISPRKRFELSNVVKKQVSCLETKRTDKDISGNLNYLHSHISKTLQAFPKLKDLYPVASMLLSEIESANEFNKNNA